MVIMVRMVMVLAMVVISTVYQTIELSQIEKENNIYVGALVMWDTGYPTF
jgi:hypothetical protein